MPNKYYAVRTGRNPGIYDTWDECKKQVDGFSGAEYKSFKSEDEAKLYCTKDKPVEVSVSGNEPVTKTEIPNNALCSSNTAVVFVDGSYNSSTNEYGYGVYITQGSRKQVLCGKGMCKEGGRNVEGEVAGARAALSFLVDKTSCNSVVLYHDYQGIGSWADGDWKANKNYTREYADFVSKCRSTGLKVEFQHVDGHTGVEGNEYVDKIAKYGCGVPLTSKDKALIAPLKNVPGMPDVDVRVTDFEFSDTDTFDFERTR